MNIKRLKLISILLCMGMTISLCGCGKDSTDNNISEPVSTPAPEEETVNTIAANTPAPLKLLSNSEGGSVYEYNQDAADYQLSIDAGTEVHEISDLLYGIFFEDINFAADGGLYAEMVQNRSFEFTSLAAGNELHAWSTIGKGSIKVVKNDTEGCLNINNPNYLTIINDSDEMVGVSNTGFLDGMSLKKDGRYKVSLYVRGMEGYTGTVNVAITNGGEVVAEHIIPSITEKWEKYEFVLTSDVESNKNVKLQVTIPKGAAAFDMISMFPEDTYKGRENGLRKDLATYLEELHPAFLRFPGGCVIEGISLKLAYDWKDSIGVDADGEPLLFKGTYGDVAARKMGQNIWTNENTTTDKYPSFMSYGLGFYEYFLLAEDIGAVGVPVINCGMACQGQSTGYAVALSSKEMRQYIQDALDLVEFCKGDSSTKWGAVRTSMGHPEPFELEYIGIGNEQWSKDYYEHYTAFVTAFERARMNNPELYGDIKLMFSAGTDDGDSGAGLYKPAYVYAESWLMENEDKTLADFTGAIDHHYYNTPDWFLSHTDYYDPENYLRDTTSFSYGKYCGGMNVFLGEYAAQSNTLRAALAEAAYMTGLERNGDIVKMAAYAPLFGNLTARHWAPDLIWFNNHQSVGSVNYYVQQIFSKNAGTTLLKSEMEGAEALGDPFVGKVGVGTWETAAKFKNVKVTNNLTGEVLAFDDFAGEDSLKNWTKISDGLWSVVDNELVQSSKSTNTTIYGNNGTVMYFGDETWTDYTYTLEATKTAGSEAFLIPFAVQDKNNNWFWNIGGWGNTISCLQHVEGGVKSGQIAGTLKRITMKANKTYSLKIVVSGTRVQCFIDEELYVDYDINSEVTYESYQVVSTDSTGDIIIKLVNVTGEDRVFAIDIQNGGKLNGTAKVDSVAGTSLGNDNVLGQTEEVILKSYEVTGITDKFDFAVPKYSVTVLRIKRQ